MKWLNSCITQIIIERHYVYVVLLLSSSDIFILIHIFGAACSLLLELFLFVDLCDSMERQLDLHVSNFNLIILSVGHTVVETCDLPQQSVLCSTVN